MGLGARQIKQHQKKSQTHKLRQVARCIHPPENGGFRPHRFGFNFSDRVDSTNQEEKNSPCQGREMLGAIPHGSQINSKTCDNPSPVGRRSWHGSRHRFTDSIPPISIGKGLRQGGSNSPFFKNSWEVGENFRPQKIKRINYWKNQNE